MLAFALVFAGVTFVGSGLGKLITRGAVDAFLEGLGVARKARAPLGFIIGIAEVALGLLFFSGTAARWLAIAGAVLAAGFLGAHLLAKLRAVQPSAGALVHSTPTSTPSSAWPGRPCLSLQCCHWRSDYSLDLPSPESQERGASRCSAGCWLASPTF